MKISTAFISIAVLGLTFCTSEKDPSIENWWVNGSRISCEGVFPMNCLQIQKTEKFDPEAWQVFYDEIDGFEPQAGIIYQVKVKVNPLANPIPQDASALHYQLLGIISRQTTENIGKFDVWKVTQVYQFMNPMNPLSKDPLLFEFNLSEKTYSGDLGCNHVHGQIIGHTGSSLRFGLGASTKMACEDMSIERAVGKGLKDTRTYRIQEEKMRFMDEKGKIILEFEKLK